MLKKQVNKFRTLLEKKRNEILNDRSQIEDRTHSNPSNFSIHAADVAGDHYDHQTEIQLLNREENFLKQVTKALKRIEDGSFGVCGECGEAIPEERLEAKPSAWLCVECRQKKERGGKIS